MGTDVRGLTRLGSLPSKIQPEAFSSQRQGWKTPRGPSGGLLLHLQRRCTIGKSPWGEQVHGT